MPDEADVQPLKGRVLRGLSWNAASGLASQACRLLVGIVLARLLSPHDYGLAGMVLVFASLALVLSDFSLGAGLVQRESITDSDASTVFWTSCGVGLVMMLVTASLASPIASFYGEPAVRPLVLGFSLTFLLSSLGTVQAALLQREMRFRSLELRIAVANVAGGITGVTVAVSGFGAWALIAQQIATSAISTGMLWIVSPWRPKFGFSPDSLRDLSGFGLRVFSSRLLFYVNRNADNILIARFLGPAALGVYSLAYNVMLMPLSRVAAPVQATLLPVIARLQHDPARVGEVWLRSNRMVVAITAPVTLGLIAVAPDFVPVLLGDRWRDLPPVLEILALVALMQSLTTLCSNILTALGHVGTLVRYAMASTTLQVTAFVVGLHWGIVGVATCYALANIVLVPLNIWLSTRVLGMTLMTYARNLSGISQASLGMFVVCVILRHALSDAGLSVAVRLITSIAVATIVYVGLSFWRAPEIVAELKSIGFHRFRLKAGPSVT